MNTIRQNNYVIAACYGTKFSLVSIVYFSNNTTSIKI